MKTNTLLIVLFLVLGFGQLAAIYWDGNATLHISILVLILIVAAFRLKAGSRT